VDDPTTTCAINANPTRTFSTMVTLEKIQSSLFSNLYESFLIDDDPLSDEQDWRSVFDYQWEKEEDHCGYALLDEGKVVGMLGMVFSERLIDGSKKKFCNLHTWWVREDHRGRSLSLLRPILKLDEYTITHFTPCDTVRAVTKRLGFTDLSSQLRILLPNRFFSGNHTTDDSSLIYDQQAIAERLAEHEKRILRDHQPYGCGHLLVSDGDDYCYLLYTHVVRHRMPYCHIHYISNKALFVAREPTIRRSLLDRHHARFVVVDDRMVQGIRFRRSFKFWAPANALYKSSDVGPDQIDNLYSDVVFLKLTVLPDLTHEMKQLAGRLWPFSKS
jgi:hypothetical protein